MIKESISKAKEALKGRWWNVFGTLLLYSVLVSIPSSIASAIDSQNVVLSLIATILVLPLVLGAVKYCFDVVEGAGSVKQLFAYYTKLNVVGKYILIALLIFVKAIWPAIVGGLLVVLVGSLSSPVIGQILSIIFAIAYAVYAIILALNYSFACYYIIDKEDAKVGECMKASKEMMKGNKVSLFFLPFVIVWLPIVLMIVGGVLFSLIFMSSTFAIFGGIIFVVAIILFLTIYPLYMLAYISFYKIVKNKANLTIGE